MSLIMITCYKCNNFGHYSSKYDENKTINASNKNDPLISLYLDKNGRISNQSKKLKIGYTAPSKRVVKRTQKKKIKTIQMIVQRAFMTDIRFNFLAM